MTRRAALLRTMLLISVSLQACTSPRVTDEDVDVWRAVVAQFCRNELPKIAVLSTDTLDVVAQKISGPNGNLEQWADLTRRGKVRAVLPSDLGCPGLRYAREATIDRTFESSDAIPPKWDGFYRQFPGADTILKLSLPGYTRDRSGAIVLGSVVSCDGFCGNGDFIKLVRRGGAWKVTEVETAWIS